MVHRERGGGKKIHTTLFMETIFGLRLSYVPSIDLPALQSTKNLFPLRARVRADIDTLEGIGSSGDISAETRSKLTTTSNPSN
jgi:hypothetical protein